MRAQIITTETDVLVVLLVCDMYGVLDGQMMVSSPPQSPTFGRHIKIRFAVGHAFVEAEYDGTGQTVQKSSNITLDTVSDVPYNPFTVLGTTYYRLPMTSDEGRLRDLPRGTFPVFVLKIPKGTFEVTGECKVALCEVFANAGFSGSEQGVWQKYQETTIKMQTI